MKKQILLILFCISVFSLFSQNIEYSMNGSFKQYDSNDGSLFDKRVVNWEINHFIPKIYYCAAKNSLVFFYVKDYSSYYGRQVIALVSIEYRDGKFENEKTRKETTFSANDKTTIQEYISKFPFELQEVKTNKSFNLSKTLVRCLGSTNNFEATELFKVKVFSKSQKIFINIDKESVDIYYAQMSKDVEKKITKQFLNYIVEEKKWTEFFSLIKNEGFCNSSIINYVVSHNFQYFAKHIGYTLEYIGGFIDKKTKLELLNEYFKNESYEEDKGWLRKNYREFISDISEKELYDAAKPNQITTAEQYANYIKFYPNDINNDSLNLSIFNNVKSNSIELANILKINPKFNFKTNVGEIEMLDNVKSGEDVLGFIKVFPKPIKTKKCKINQYYSGDIVNGLANGFGKSINEGKLYIGQFRDGKYNGKGKLYYGIGCIEYEGDFVDGLPNGKGVYYNWTLEKKAFDNVKKFYLQSKYEGNITNGLYNGKGKLSIPHEYIYEGSFVNGKKEGFFTEFTVNWDETRTSNEYEKSGTYINDLREGLWFTKWVDKSFGMYIPRNKNVYYSKGEEVDYSNSSANKTDDSYEVLASENSNVIVKNSENKNSYSAKIWSEGIIFKDEKDLSISFTNKFGKTKSYYGDSFASYFDDYSPVIITVSFESEKGKKVYAKVQAKRGVEVNVYVKW